MRDAAERLRLDHIHAHGAQLLEALREVVELVDGGFIVCDATKARAWLRRAHGLIAKLSPATE